MQNKDLNNITVNMQSSIRISGEKTIYFDPIKISTEEHDADIIFISHEHYDHFEPESIEKIANEETVIICPASMKSRLVETVIPAGHQYIVTPGGQYEVAGLKVETIAAYNKLKPFHPKKNGWVGYIVEMDGVRYYFAGDSDATREVKSVSCDVALIPIGGTYTMNAKEAAELVNEMKPKYVIPVHYGSIVGKMQDAEEFKKRVLPEVKVVLKI